MLSSKATMFWIAIAWASTPHAARQGQELKLPSLTAEEQLRCSTGKLIIRQQPRTEGRLHEVIVETGTAFFIDRAGDMLTAAHVYFGVPPLREGWVERRTILFESGAFELPAPSAGETREQAHLDVVKFPTNLRPPCYLALGTSKGLRTGTELETFGFPNDHAPAEDHPHFEEHQPHRGNFQTGRLLDQGVFPDGRPMLRAGFFGEEGMSGSPISTLAGNVIGILLSKEHNGHTYIFAIPAEELKDILEDRI